MFGKRFLERSYTTGATTRKTEELKSITKYIQVAVEFEPWSNVILQDRETGHLIHEQRYLGPLIVGFTIPYTVVPGESRQIEEDKLNNVKENYKTYSEYKQILEEYPDRVIKNVEVGHLAHEEFQYEEVYRTTFDSPICSWY